MNSILLISPVFFSYSDIIKSEIEKKGFSVDFFDDRPPLSTFSKALIRKFPFLFNLKIKKYIDHIIYKSKKKYSKVIVILGQLFDKQDIVRLKSNIEADEWVYYAWDSFANFKNIEEIYRLFDRSYSFDRSNCKSVEGLEFLPLFYTFKGSINFSEKKDRALIISTIKKGKMKATKQVINELEKFMTVDKYLFLQSKLVFLYFKLFDKGFKGMKMKDFKYTRLNYEKTIKLMDEYKYIIDVPMYRQVGLTIRTFEALALNCKLLTSNGDIVNYDFYNSSNIFIFNRDNIKDFLSCGYETNCYILNYSASKFVERLLGI